MINRIIQADLLQYLATFPVVALLGPRQVGKTTLALALRKAVNKPCHYLDLELDSDQSKLAEPELYLRRFANQLIILDEIQRAPNLFTLLRALVDQRKQNGEMSGHFLILGSASPDLLKQSSESLAGRIGYLELTPFHLSEVVMSFGEEEMNIVERLWFRGGFPESYLADSESQSSLWRQQFIRTYTERDIPLLMPRLPGERVRLFWNMLAHNQGGLLNAERVAGSLGISGNTIRHYLDVLTDLYMVRQLRAWSGNSLKRLIKSPRIYIRDSGIVHEFLKTSSLDMLLGHMICGASWEGFVIENIIAHVGETWEYYFYRTGAGAEIDLVLCGPRGQRIAIDIKRTLSPVLSKGFILGCEDIQATHRYFVIPQGTSYPLAAETEAIGIREFLQRQF